MAFNWIRPASVVEELVQAVRQLPMVGTGSEREGHGFTESDLQD
jgi:hypothetical protein